MQKLNNKWALTVRGFFLICVGVLLFTINENSSKCMVLFFSVLTFLAGFAGIRFAATNKTDQFKSNWLMLESGADIILSFISFYLYLKSTTLTVDFLIIFACFALVFAFLQVIYIFQIFQTEINLNIKTVAVRAILGVGYGLFGIVLLFKSSFPSASTAIINFIGIGPLLAGIALLVLSSQMYTVNKKLVY